MVGSARVQLRGPSLDGLYFSFLFYPPCSTVHVVSDHLLFYFLYFCFVLFFCKRVYWGLLELFAWFSLATLASTIFFVKTGFFFLLITLEHGDIKESVGDWRDVWLMVL
eukprot:Phypoly_transcript_29235.p1 GENE.Phypoly_transcript_29235~~Phypoly_transcript_29235.p1  ORF type:complete len:109 (-),score=6.03 Phypoly_transcript_29235:36-362(-)